LAQTLIADTAVLHTSFQRLGGHGAAYQQSRQVNFPILAMAKDPWGASAITERKLNDTHQALAFRAHCPFILKVEV
jgi:hypothetical protein